MPTEQTRGERAEHSISPSAELATAFRTRAGEAYPGLEVTLDIPVSPEGDCWVTIRSGALTLEIQVNARTGFGFHTDDAVFGDRPSEIYRSADAALKRLGQLVKKQARSPLDLSDIRKLKGLTQRDMAERLSATQPSITQMERRDTMKLNTIDAYARALGGRLETRIVFDDMNLTLRVGDTGACRQSST